jgi:hypothetical protein
MLTDVVAAIWQKPQILTWITAWGFCPTELTVLSVEGVDGVLSITQDLEAIEGRAALHRSRQVTPEKCLAFLAPPRTIEVVLPALWCILQEYDLHRESHSVLSRCIRDQVSMPKNAVWVLANGSFLSYATGVVVNKVATVGTKVLDKDTTAVKIPSSLEVHKCLFDHLVSLM